MDYRRRIFKKPDASSVNGEENTSLHDFSNDTNRTADLVFYDDTGASFVAASVQAAITALDSALALVGNIATDSIWDAKGDLVAASGADAAARLPVGADGYVLTADSAEVLGIKWAAAPGGGLTEAQVRTRAFMRC